jgi:hypothetical protein
MKSLAAVLTVVLLAPGVAFADKATGGIKGTVIFVGEAPDRPKLKRDTDPYCKKIDKLSDDVVITNGKLKDVLVRIRSAPLGTYAAPASAVVIDQRECMYTPRVVGMMAGQKLAVRNSDGTFHNVRGTLAGKLLWNKPMPAKDPDLALETGKAGDVVEVQCDVHPWMHAYAVVMDHPFFAVTGEDGAFEIKNLPPGSYTLEAWHPTLGKQSLDLKIGSGAKAIVPARITYKPSER